MNITIDKAKQELEMLLGKSDAMSESFHMGRVGFRSDVNKVNASIDKSINDAIRITELSKFIKDEESKQAISSSKYYTSTSDIIKGQQYIDIWFGEVKVIKINKNTVTIKTKSGYTENRKPSFLYINK